jgi:hypothetical protein
MLLAEDFNNNEKCFKGIYTYPKKLYTKDLSVGMKTILKKMVFILILSNLYAECNSAHLNSITNPNTLIR